MAGTTANVDLNGVNTGTHNVIIPFDMTHSSGKIKEKIKSYVLQETFAESEKIRDESLIFKEGYFDSMGFVRLVSFLETEFRLKIYDNDLEEQNFESINAITDFVISKR
jgi:acyl carrier protein